MKTVYMIQVQHQPHNCGNRNDRFLKSKCLTTNIVYQTTIKVKGEPKMFYIDASEETKETIITKLVLQEVNMPIVQHFFFIYLQKLKDKSEEIPGVKWRI